MSEEGLLNPGSSKQLPTTASAFSCYVVVVHAAMGAGILALPYAFNSFGLIIALVGTFFFAFLMSTSLYLMVRGTVYLLLLI